MPVVEWTKRMGERVMGPYRWHPGNLYRCNVRPVDYLEVITNPDFVCRQRDLLALLEGLGREEAQALEFAGIVTFRELVEEPAATLAARTGLEEDRIRDWQEQARGEVE